MDLEIRQITAETFPQYHDAISIPFQFDRNDEVTQNFLQVDELDRSFAVMDDGAMVGTFGAYTYQLSTPGGIVPAGGLTAVTVMPTHRRQGVLTAMMERHFEDIRERSEPVSILWASEWPIYGRFGYGQATEGVTVEIDTTHAELTPAETTGSTRMVDAAEAEEVFPEVYERVRARAGMLDRSPTHWKHRHFFDHESWRGGFTAYRFTVYEDNGRVDGYVQWRSKDNWEGGIAGGSARVVEMIAATPEAERGLWQFLLDLDLTTSVTAGRRPVDDGLQMMLVDRRRIKRTIHDALWVAILDVPGALEGRRYGTDDEVVIGVAGSPYGIDGRYQLRGSDGHAECTPTDAVADITLSASDLGALYLGGARVAPMVRWGTAVASPDVIRRVDAMFAWDEPPWCPEVF